MEERVLDKLDISNDDFVKRVMDYKDRLWYFNMTNMVQYDPDTTSFYIRRNDGQILPKEDAMTVIKGLINFYVKTYSKEDIDKINDEIKGMQRQEENGEKIVFSGKTRKEVESIVGTKPGYVYFIKEHNTNTIKIGKSKKLSDRMSVFTVKLPFEWDFVCAYYSNHMDTLEEILHEYYSDKRVNGEWFDLTDKDIEKIKNRKLPKKINILVEKVTHTTNN